MNFRIVWRTVGTVLLIEAGLMLAANEVPEIAKQFGLDTSIKAHFSTAVHNTTMAVSLIKAVTKR